MSRMTTIAISNLHRVKSLGGRVDAVADISFRCSDCGDDVEWTNFYFQDVTEPAKAASQPAIWCCDDCQATRDEIYANRNAGI